MSARILLVDDERDIRDPVAYALEREGWAVECREDGEAALAAARTTNFDVVILDVIMPRLSGLDVCRQLRTESDVPILILTARDAEVDRVLGLELGADDYVTKPFSTPELVSRVRALLRRRQLDRQSGAASICEAAGVRVDFGRYEVVVDGEQVRLTPSEFKVLAMLIQEPGRVFSRTQIMEQLWDSSFVGDARAADVHVSNLRKKLERDPSHPARILTVREVGYRFAQR